MSNPTAAQKRMWNKLVSLGCIACRIDGHNDTPAEIHHIKDYGNHNHDRVIPLCQAHHNGKVKEVPSIHMERIKFIEKYGSCDELLGICMMLIGHSKTAR